MVPAGYQTGDRLVVPENIGLLRVPPYSPELSPVENIWRRMEQVYGRARADQINRHTRLGQNGRNMSRLV